MEFKAEAGGAWGCVVEGVDKTAVQLRQKWKHSRMDFASMNCFGEVVTLWAGTQACLSSEIDLVMDLCSERPLAAPMCVETTGQQC